MTAADADAPVTRGAALLPSAVTTKPENEPMTTVRVRARLATSHPIPAYGGIQLSEEMLADVAQAMNDGSIPMHFGHDISRPVRVSRVEAGIERLDDGYLSVWAEFDADSSAWAVVEDEFREAGVRGGMSISFSAPLAGGHLFPDASAVVAADAHHFDDEAIREAAAALSNAGLDSGGERLYQFSGIPEAAVVFDLVLPVIGALGINLAASLIYDAAKHLLTKRRTSGRTIFNLVFRETRRGDRKLQIRIEAESQAELRSALAQVPAVLEAGLSGTYRTTNGGDLVAVKGTEPPITPSPSTRQPSADRPSRPATADSDGEGSTDDREGP